MNFIKKNYPFIFLFFFIFIIYYAIFFSYTYIDPLYYYTYSHAIVMGELPYVDFNLISTPLFIYLSSIGLFIFDHFLVFIGESSLIVTVMFYYLKQLLGNKIFILLLLILLFVSYPIMATYNLLVMFFMILLIYLEKNNSDKDLLIGIVIGLAILSKHTIGIFFLIPTIFFYFKKWKKIFKRFSGIFIVGIIFLLYLLITGSFNSFFDLCVLGLFDFANKNGRVLGIVIILSLLLFIISLIITIKNKDKIENYYLLMSFFFVVPLFDLNHFAIYLFCFIIQLLFLVPYSFDKEKKVFIITIIIFTVLLGYSYQKATDAVMVHGMKHFNNSFMSKKDYEASIKWFKYVDSFDNKILISNNKRMYDVVRDNKIDYFDALNYGNFGYNGTTKIIDKIKNAKDCYLIVDMDSYEEKNNEAQFNREIVDYIRDNYEFIEKKDVFEVYYKN